LCTSLSIAAASIGMTGVLRDGFGGTSYCVFVGCHICIASAFVQICSFAQPCT
jgi:hypothetical protein